MNSDDAVPEAGTGAESWRYACPEGHRPLRNAATRDGYWCHTCERQHDGRPRDLKLEGDDGR